MLMRYSWMETLIACIAGHRFAELWYQPNSPYPSGKVSAQSHSRIVEDCGAGEGGQSRTRGHLIALISLAAPAIEKPPLSYSQL